MNTHNAEMMYEKFMALRNTKTGEPLTRKVFESRGIYTFSDLIRYLNKNGEYGGAIPLEGTEKLTLLPFHNDIMNAWLRFDNPKVVQAYELIYAQYKNRYPERHLFKKNRFKVEESLLEEFWTMPAMDTRLLDAPILGCWDKMELQACFLNILGYEVRRFCFHSGRIIRGHTFVLFNDGIHWKIPDAYPLPIESSDVARLSKFIFWVLQHIPFLDQGAVCELVEFSKPYAGMSTREYLQLIEDGHVVMKCVRKGRHKHDTFYH